MPFGSHTKQQLLYQARDTHNLPITGGNPGPGAYGAALSPRDDAKVMGRKISPGYSFSKIGLAKDSSGTREMLFHGSQSPATTRVTHGGTISKTRKNSNQIGEPFEQTGHSFQREVSLMSLRNKGPTMRMINVDSNTSLTIRPMPSETPNRP